MAEDLDWSGECAEAECDESRVCRICGACERHCIARPNDMPAHRQQVQAALDWIIGHGLARLN